MSILFTLMVRLWAAIILTLVGVALVAAPIGAVQVEGRKPSTTTVEGRKAPALTEKQRRKALFLLFSTKEGRKALLRAFRRARKARPSPRRGAWLKSHPHSTAFRAGEVAKRRPRTEAKAMGRAIGRALEVTKKKIAHLRAKRAQGRVIPTTRVLVQAIEPVLAPKAPKEAKAKAISARALRRAERGLQMHRGSGAVNQAARKAAWFNNPLPSPRPWAGVSFLALCVEVEDAFERLTAPAEAKPVKAAPARGARAASASAALRAARKAKPAKVEPAKVEPAKVEPAKVEPAKVEAAKAKPARKRASRKERDARRAARRAEAEAAPQAPEKGAWEMWEAHCAAHPLAPTPGPTSSRALIRAKDHLKVVLARINKPAASAAAGVMYLGQQAEVLVGNTALVALLLAGVLVILARKRAQAQAESRATDGWLEAMWAGIQRQASACLLGAPHIHQEIPGGNCEKLQARKVWSETAHALQGAAVSGALDGWLPAIREFVARNSTFNTCRYGQELECGMIEPEVVEAPVEAVVQPEPVVEAPVTLEHDDYLDGAAQLVSERFDTQEYQGEEMEFVGRKGRRNTISLRLQKEVDYHRGYVSDLAASLEAKESWTVGEEPEVQGWMKSSSKTITAIEGYSPEGRRSKRQQKDKLKSRAYRAARKAAPFIVLALILRSLDLGIEGLEFAGANGNIEWAAVFAFVKIGDQVRKFEAVPKEELPQPPKYWDSFYEWNAKMYFRHLCEKYMALHKGPNVLLPTQVDGRLVAEFDGELLFEKDGEGTIYRKENKGFKALISFAAEQDEARWIYEDEVRTPFNPENVDPEYLASGYAYQDHESEQDMRMPARLPVFGPWCEASSILEEAFDYDWPDRLDNMTKIMSQEDFSYWREENQDVIKEIKAIVVASFEVTLTKAECESYGHAFSYILLLEEEKETEELPVEKDGTFPLLNILGVVVALLAGFFGSPEDSILLGGIFTSLKPLRGAKWMEEDNLSILRDERNKAAWIAKIRSKRPAWHRLEGFEEVWEEFGGEVARRIPTEELYWDDEEFSVGVTPSRSVLQVLRMDPPREIVRAAIEWELGQFCGQLPRGKELIECWVEDQYSMLGLSQKAKSDIRYSLGAVYRLKWAELFTSEERLGMAHGYADFAGLYWRALARVIQETSTPEQRGRVSMEEWQRFLASPPGFFWGISGWVSNSRYYFHDIEAPAELVALLPLLSSEGSGWLRFMQIRDEHGEALGKGLLKKLSDVGSYCLNVDPVHSEPDDILQFEKFMEDLMHLADNKQGRLGTLLFKKERLGEKMPARKEWLSLLSLLSKEEDQRSIHAVEAWQCLSICRKASATKALLDLSGQGFHQLLCLLQPLQDQRLKHFSKWLEFLCRNGSKGLKIMNYFQMLETAGYNPSQSLEELVGALKEIISPEFMDLFFLGAPIDEESVKWHQDLMLRAKPGPLPAGILAEEPGYRLRVLAHDDLTGPCLGFVVTCCQKYKGQGASCAEFGVTSPDAGFVVLEKKEKGGWRIVAQSFYWQSNTLGDRYGLCFDNIEFQQKLVYVPVIKRLYSKAGESLVGMGFTSVTVGTGYVADELVSEWPHCPPLDVPVGYTDAESQCLIAGARFNKLARAAGLGW